MAPNNRHGHSPSSWVPVSYTVSATQEELPDVVTLTLVPSDGGPALSYLPGQFTMLYVFGVGEVPISISGDPSLEGGLVQTIRAVGAVSRALTKLKEGDTVGVRGPFGAPWPVNEAHGHDLLIVAGGLGLAPVRPVIYEVLNNRRDFGDVTIFYGARSPSELLFAEEVERWVKGWDIKVFVSVDRATPKWRGHVGVVTRLLNKAAFEAPQTLAFVCGPEIMMRVTSDELVPMGIPPDQIFLSMERNMKCAIGHCGHCQLGPFFVCKDGPVLPASKLSDWLKIREV